MRKPWLLYISKAMESLGNKFLNRNRNQNMVDADLNNFVLSFSIVSYFLDFLHVLRKLTCMAALRHNSPPSSRRQSSLYLPKSKKHSLDASSFNQRLITKESLEVGSCDKRMCSRQEGSEKGTCVKLECPQESSGVVMQEIGEVKGVSKMRKRPARIVVPEFSSGLEVGEPSQKEFEMEGKYFFVASRKGRRDVMEDGYDAITDVMGDSKQAFFGVFDGHGGSAAVNFVAENLGKKILGALKEVEEANDPSTEAIKKGYLATENEFLSKHVSSGVCAATVLVKEGELYAANVGDCRVVLSRNGIASALTNDHRLDREDERLRIENSGGYVNCQNGVWRVQGSLAISRAIGDLYCKQWVISDPEIKKLELTSDCEFLVIASDGLWDKVSNQEAVDVVLRHNNSIESCKQLIDISSSRGNRDDITVMVVDLQNFKRLKC